MPQEPEQIGGIAQEEREGAPQLDVWRKRAEGLFQLLDDIDTADDVAKSNDQLYREMVRKLHRRRLTYAESPDGQRLVWKKDVPPLSTFHVFESDTVPPGTVLFIDRITGETLGVIEGIEEE